MNTALGENRERLRVNGKEYAILKLLGKGKGGYSYLAHDGGKEVVLKQIHHEPCDYMDQWNFENSAEVILCRVFLVILFER